MMKKYLNPDSIANEIRMTRGQHKGAFLLVEGSTDALLFEKLTNENCKVLFSNGKDNAIRIMEILESSKFSGVLAIVDSDFWFLDNITPQSPNILVTDGHDLEIMMIFSDALEKVLAEFGSSRSIKNLGMNVRDLLIKLALPLGILRMLSASTRKNLELNFREMQYMKFLDFDKKNVYLMQMVTEIIMNTRGSNLNAKSIVSDINDQIERALSVVEHVCNGHDMIEILVLGLNKMFSNFRSKELNLTSDSLRSIFRLSYDQKCFSKTNLHSYIKEWEQVNPNFPIL